ncbi:MAG: hypothetical protein IJ391_07585, partial [Clostridia bacterium]|nr:hypothetical protein [Clostridia bacterium]
LLNNAIIKFFISDKCSPHPSFADAKSTFSAGEGFKCRISPVCGACDYTRSCGTLADTFAT